MTICSAKRWPACVVKFGSNAVIGLLYSVRTKFCLIRWICNVFDTSFSRGEQKQITLLYSFVVVKVTGCIHLPVVLSAASAPEP